DRRAGGIEARIATLRHHAGQVRQAYADRGEAIPVESAGDLDRLEAARAGRLQLALEVVDVDLVEIEKLPKLLDGAVGVLRTLRDDVDAEVRAVGGQRSALAVEDPSTPRGYQGEV